MSVLVERSESILTKMTTTPKATTSILDIRQNDPASAVPDDMRTTLRFKPGLEKAIPALLLYDEHWLKLFEEISCLDGYYLTSAETEVLKIHAGSIAESIPTGCQLIDLGSGYGFACPLQH